MNDRKREPWAQAESPAGPHTHQPEKSQQNTGPLSPELLEGYKEKPESGASEKYREHTLRREASPLTDAQRKLGRGTEGTQAFLRKGSSRGEGDGSPPWQVHNIPVASSADLGPELGRWAAMSSL